MDGDILDLIYPQSVCKNKDGKDIPCEKSKNVLKIAVTEIYQDKICNEKLQGKVLTAREDKYPNRKVCFAWLSMWAECAC